MIIHKLLLKIFLFAVTLLLINFGTAVPVWAWADHSLFAYSALCVMDEVKQAGAVSVEKLEDFLIKEKSGLIKLLNEQEDSLRKYYPDYIKNPDELVFNQSNKKNIRYKFFTTLRINPGIKMTYYLQRITGYSSGSIRSISPGQITILKNLDSFKNYTFTAINKNEKAMALDVIATATDEPDYGLDIGLFEDNQTLFGKIYGFGKQLFGDPRLEFSSQASFHMGIYHESPLIYMLAGYLKKTMPEYRIYQFFSLSKFAFQTGHNYWAWRFLGWAAHYIEDLTQPYHARILPGYGTAQLFFASFLDILGFHKNKKEIIEQISDNHLALEHYLETQMRTVKGSKQMNAPLIKALQKLDKEQNYPRYDQYYAREIVSKESYEQANNLANLLKVINLNYRLSELKDNALKDALDAILRERMESFGVHTRKIVKAALNRF